MENSLFGHSKVFCFPESADYSDEGIISKRVIDRPSGTVTLFSFDKGQRLSTHSAPFDALVQVVEGRAEIIIEENIFQLHCGETIIMPAGIPHAVNAVERFKMVLTMIKG
ncbi:MAG: cupin domain-containing protein [Bacteroidota bacterium]